MRKTSKNDIIANLKKEIEALKKELTEKNEAIEELKIDHSDCGSTKAELEAQIDELKTDVGNAERSNDDYREEVLDLEEQLGEKESEMTRKLKYASETVAEIFDLMPREQRLDILVRIGSNADPLMRDAMCKACIAPTHDRQRVFFKAS